MVYDKCPLGATKETKPPLPLYAFTSNVSPVYNDKRAVVECKILRGGFVEFVHLRKADIGSIFCGDDAVGIDASIHVAVFGIVVPRAVEIAPQKA